MRFLFKLTLWLILLSPVALATFVWFALEKQPTVAPSRTLNHADIARAQQVIEENDPRKLSTGTERKVRISEHELNLAANYLLQRIGGSIQAKVRQDVAQLSGSVRIPGLPLKPHLNISLSVDNSGGKPRVSDLRIGQVPLPDLVARLVIREVLSRLYRTERGELAGDIIKDLELSAGQIAIIYRWQPDLIGRTRDILMSRHERESVAAYYDELTALQVAGRVRDGSLPGALQPLFQLAQQRSMSSGDPVSENRSLLLFLGVWAANKGMGQLLPTEARQGRIKGFRLSLDNRNDLGQHFLVSAAISSGSDSMLSDAVGLFKEARDSQGSSGFSFVDLAADRAGSRFGEVATRSVASARRVQQLLAAGLEEIDIFPKVGDLPEHLSAAEFQRRYGEIDSPTYNKIAKEIERRIAACFLYQST